MHAMHPGWDRVAVFCFSVVSPTGTEPSAAHPEPETSYGRPGYGIGIGIEMEFNENKIWFDFVVFCY